MISEHATVYMARVDHDFRLLQFDGRVHSFFLRITGAFLAATVWGGQRGGQICFFLGGGEFRMT